MFRAIAWTIFAAALYAQPEEHPAVAYPQEIRVVRPAPDNSAFLKSLAVRDLTMGFNTIGQHASVLRGAMSTRDAEAFDAVMLDVMSALLALPGVDLAPSGDPARITPTAPRYDRIPQIAPDLLGLENFFARLDKTARSASQSRLFDQARKSVQKMLKALPRALPTLSVQQQGGAPLTSPVSGRPSSSGSILRPDDR
jgi:hypothetical protein